MEYCVLCHRDRPTTKHHLIPRTVHSNKWFKKHFTRGQMQSDKIDLCKDCHNKVHSTLDSKQLGREFNTLESLRDHPEIKKFVGWIRKRR